MAMTDLANWSQLLSSIAVLVTLVYLAIEVKQNTEALRVQTRQSVLEVSQTELFKGMENPEVVSSLVDPDHLSQEGYIKLHCYLTGTMRAREFAWLQYHNGIIDKEQWQTEQGVIIILLTTRRTRVWWEEIGRGNFNPPFVAFVDEILDGQEDTGLLNKVLDWES